MSTFFPCVVFGQIVQGLPENKDKPTACIQYGSAYFALGYVLPGCLGGVCSATALAGGAAASPSALSLLAHAWAGHLNGRVLGSHSSGECFSITKGVVCLPCSLCQAKNYADTVATAKVGRAGTMLRAPKMLKM